MNNKFFNIILTLFFSVSFFSCAMFPEDEIYTDDDTEEVYGSLGDSDDSDIEIEDSDIE